MKQKLRLLYAEDNEITAREISEGLQRHGFEVTTVHDGNKAWLAFQEISPDIVLLDQSMPYKSGTEIFQLIRKTNPTIPVLILSSYTEYCVKVLKMGAADFVRKESSIDEICIRIDLAWQRSQGIDVSNFLPDADLYQLTNRTSYHAGTHILTIDGQSTPLPGMQATLLAIFCQNQDIYVSQEILCKRLWNTQSQSKIHLLQDYISKLRHLLSADTELSLHASYGRGYCLQTFKY